MTTGVIYARVSSIGDRQSTERQVKDLSEYAKYKGIEVCKVFEEHISGAKKNDERPVLCEAMEYCKANRIGILLVSELSRLGRNAFEVLASVKELIDCGINLYIQKEQLTLLDDEVSPSLFAPIMIATLSTCAQLERDNISFRLQSGRKRYIEKGGKLGRKCHKHMRHKHSPQICIYPIVGDEKHNHQNSYRTGEQIDEEHLLCFAQTMQYAAEHSTYVHQRAQKTQLSKKISTKLR